MSEALDFAREPQNVREAYGMTLFGQSCLAARRLVEAGSKFVTVIWDAWGGDVEENPVSPKDVLATAFYLLGIDPESTFPDPEGRPLPITGTGQFRPELLG